MALRVASTFREEFKRCERVEFVVSKTTPGAADLTNSHSRIDIKTDNFAQNQHGAGPGDLICYKSCSPIFGLKKSLLRILLWPKSNLICQADVLIIGDMKRLLKISQGTLPLLVLSPGEFLEKFLPRFFEEIY